MTSSHYLIILNQSKGCGQFKYRLFVILDAVVCFNSKKEKVITYELLFFSFSVEANFKLSPLEFKPSASQNWHERKSKPTQNQDQIRQWTVFMFFPNVKALLSGLLRCKDVDQSGRVIIYDSSFTP